jgi:hypothetical protein
METPKFLGNGFLAFDLPAEPPTSKADEIAAFLQENISSVSYRCCSGIRVKIDSSACHRAGDLARCC